ncbi:MAG: hypothetical protein K2Y27_35225 [Xanthobacteraceae bacterium]|nr:hypothetical protein [Xanthobacteraceae bacterium]
MKKPKKRTPENSADVRRRELMQSADPRERLEGYGLGLFGPSWKAPMGRHLGVSRQTINNWMSQATSMPHDIDAQVAELSPRVRNEYVEFTGGAVAKMDEVTAFATAAAKKLAKQHGGE